MSTKLSCIIVDDEPLARKGLANFIAKIPFLNLAASCNGTLQLMDELNQGRCDLLFLDIQMPEMTGIEFMRTLHSPPATIITTAYSDYALESYELPVIDYLVKPIPFERFLKGVNKAKDFYELKNFPKSGIPELEYFFIKCENRYEKIVFHELQFVQAMQNYVILHTEKKRYISYLTLKGVEEFLPESKFIKVNKSNIVSLSNVDHISGNELTIGTHTFHITPGYKDEILKNLLKYNKLLKRK